MITALLVKLKHSCPALWHMVESINGTLMRLRRPRAASQASAILQAASASAAPLAWSLVQPADLPALSAFLNSIPPARRRHFDPHPFDIPTLRAMLRSGSFIMIKVTDGTPGPIVGYHFLRCFFTGRAFHGLTVAETHAGRGIGTRMWALAADICHTLRLDMMATISESNHPSLASCRRGCDATVVDRLPGSYLLLRCTPRRVSDQ